MNKNSYLPQLFISKCPTVYPMTPEALMPTLSSTPLLRKNAYDSILLELVPGLL